MISPYTVVPGTDIVHSTIDSYELYDEAEGMTYRVELQCDNGGIYIRSSQKRHEEDSENITEDMSIANKDLAICVAKKILQIYNEN